MQKELNCKKAEIILPHRLACEDNCQSHKLPSLSLVKHKDLPVKFCKPLPRFYKLFKVLGLVSARKRKFISLEIKKKNICILLLKLLAGKQDNLQVLMFGI